MSPIQISTTSTSVDEMSEKTGFDLDFCQLEAGEPLLKSKITILSSIASTRFLFDKSFLQKGMAPEGCFAFGCMSGQSLSRYAGKSYGSEYLFDLNGRSGFETRTSSLFTAKSIHVKADRLHDIAELQGIDLSGLGKNDYGEPRHVDSIKLQMLEEAIQNVENLVPLSDNQPQWKSELATVEDTVYLTLADCLDTSQRADRPSFSNRMFVLRRALDYIHSHCCEPITITDMSRACATTSRTLERVFRAEFGATPKQYITKARLSKARRALFQNSLETSITDIASSCGFLHMSQFAKDYKTQYGELPSQTRQRRNITPEATGYTLK